MICTHCRRDVLGGNEHDCRERLKGREERLEAALVALIDAVASGNRKRIEDAMFVGRGLTF
jgi:hypothetical protein